MNKQELSFLVIVTVLIGCGTSKISDKEAIRLAEKYVFENGYTNKELKIDSTKIQSDIAERAMNKKEMVELRRNTLKPKAAFQSKGLRRWTVGFQSKQDSSRFRILRIYRNGKRIEMEHQDLDLINDD